MIEKSQQVQLKKLLSEAVLLLCRNGLPIDSQFSIEAMIGITLSEDEVLLVSFRETVAPDSAENFQDLPRTDRIATFSRSNRKPRKDVDCAWTESPVEICESPQNLDSGDTEIDHTFSYESGLRNRTRGAVIKSEVDDYVEDFSSDFVPRNTDFDRAAKDEVCESGEFESEVKLESDGYGLESFDSSSSVRKVVDARNVVSSRWVAANHKGRTRSQRLQRSTGSRYVVSDDQRRNGGGPVYMESAESLASVEKILSAIYPPTTDNQSLRCHVCGAELKGRRTLMEHIRGTHLAIHSYHCPDCGLGFKWRSSLKHHRARNCTLPSVLAAAFDGRPAASGRQTVQWIDNN